MSNLTETVSIESLRETVFAPMGLDLEQLAPDHGYYSVEESVASFRVWLVLYGPEEAYTGIQLRVTWRDKVDDSNHFDSLKAINAWNHTKRIGKAYLDKDRDPVIETDLDLDGGVAVEAIQEWVRLFHRAVGQFSFTTLMEVGV